MNFIDNLIFLPSKFNSIGIKFIRIKDYRSQNVQ